MLSDLLPTSQALKNVADQFADRTVAREWFGGTSFCVLLLCEANQADERRRPTIIEWRARLHRNKQLQQTEIVARAKSEQVSARRPQVARIVS